MPFSQGANLAAGLELVFSNFEQFENKFYETKYQDIFWRNAIPGASIETNINPGAVTASYGIEDWRGVGGFISDFGHDAPTVFFSRDKVTVPLAYAGVKGVYTLEDVRTYGFAYGGSFNTDLANVMRMGTERHMEGVLMYGQSELGFNGYIDLDGVSVANVVNPGSGTEWVNKTADQILFDINDAITDVWVDSKQKHLPDTLELPPTQYAYLVNTRIADAVDNSIIKYLMENNLYKTKTGRDLNIVVNPHLDSAGVSGVDRFMVKENSPENFKMPFPIPHNLLPPQPVAYAVNLYAEYKFGPIHVRYPGAMAYRDGI